MAEYLISPSFLAAIILDSENAQSLTTHLVCLLSLTDDIKIRCVYQGISLFIVKQLENHIHSWLHPYQISELHINILLSFTSMIEGLTETDTATLNYTPKVLFANAASSPPVISKKESTEKMHFHKHISCLIHSCRMFVKISSYLFNDDFSPKDHTKSIPPNVFLASLNQRAELNWPLRTLSHHNILSQFMSNYLTL